MTPDPLGGSALVPQTINRYSYVTNDPVNLVDTLGLQFGAFSLFFSKAPLLHDGWFASGGAGGGLCRVDFGAIMPCWMLRGQFESGTATVSPYDSNVICVGNRCFLLAGWNEDADGPFWVYGRITAGELEALGRRLRDLSETLWLQGKVFLQGLGRNFVEEFKEGGCVWMFIQATGESLASPLPSGLGAPVGAFYGAVKLNDALRYAATKPSARFRTPFLLYPQKSTVFRGLLRAAGRAAAVGALLAVDISMFQGFVREMQALGDGSCR